MNNVFNALPYYGASSSILQTDGSELIDSTFKAVPTAWAPGGLSVNDVPAGTSNANVFGTLYPYPGVLSNICIDSEDTYKVIKPGESVSIPLGFWYWFATSTADAGITKEIAFDFRTSLYKDPVTYRLTVKTGNTAKVYSKVRRDSGYVGSKYTASVTKVAADTKSKLTTRGSTSLATVKSKGSRKK